MSVQNPRVQRSIQAAPSKPLARTQSFLVELKNVIILLREVCEELKGLVVILLLLAIFILEASKFFH